MAAELDAVLVMFAKAPVPGQVKTRLQPVLSAAQSAALYQRMVCHIVSGLAGQTPLIVYRYGDKGHPFWSQLEALGIDCFADQRGQDLGERMYNAVGEQLALGHRAVILIGGDCPAVDGEYIQLALAALNQGADVVVGPAQDGGYVLLGLKQAWSELFSDMPWGSDRVCDLSLQRCRSMNIAVDTLPTLTDIDRPEDLCCLPKELI
jgi:rSAM/selenodomain-associated transferase 1